MKDQKAQQPPSGALQETSVSAGSSSFSGLGEQVVSILPAKHHLVLLGLLALLPIIVSSVTWRLLLKKRSETGAYGIGIVVDRLDSPEDDPSTAYGVRAAMDYYNPTVRVGREGGVMPPRIFNFHWRGGMPKAVADLRDPTSEELETALNNMCKSSGLPPAYVSWREVPNRSYRIDAPNVDVAKSPVVTILGLWTTDQVSLLYHTLMNMAKRAGGGSGKWTVQFVLEQATLSQSKRNAMINELSSLDRDGFSPLVFTGAYNDDEADLILDWVAGALKKPGVTLRNAWLVKPPETTDSAKPGAGGGQKPAATPPPGANAYAADLLDLLLAKKGSIEFKVLEWDAGLDILNSATAQRKQDVFVFLQQPDQERVNALNGAMGPKVSGEKQTNFIIFTDSWHSPAMVQELRVIPFDKPTLAIVSTVREAKELKGQGVPGWDGLPQGTCRGDSLFEDQKDEIGQYVATRPIQASWAHLFGRRTEARFAYGWDLYLSYILLHRTADSGGTPLKSLISGSAFVKQFRADEPADLWGYGKKGKNSWVVEFPQANQ